MARRRRASSPPPEDEAEDWMTTYADAITLLMAFFVMLVSFSKIDLPMFDDVQAGIAEKLGGATDTETPIFTLEAQLQSVLSEASPFPPDAVNVGFDDEGVVIDFAAGYFFQPGTTVLTDGAEDVIAAVYRQLLEPPYDVFKLDIQGHTSDKPTQLAQYPTNWELSASQAARILREFLALGMKPEWMKASGYADTQPKAPNRDLAQNPIVANQRKNERISVRLYP